MLTSEEIETQQELLVTSRRTLAHLLQQAAAYGGLPFAPPATANGIAEARATIARSIAILREQGVPVDDDLDDAAPEARRAVVSDGSSPYLGLLTFQEADADRFFGRETLIGDLVA